MTDFEERVSEALARKSADAPPVHGLDEASRARHRRRHRTRVASVAAIVTGAVLTTSSVLATRNTGSLGETATTPAPSATPTPSAPTTSTTPSPPSGSPGCAELNGRTPPATATPVRPVPDADAQHTTFNASGTVAAWFNQSGPLPELIVFDLASNERLAYEDLGVGDVAQQPSLQIVGDAVYYRSAADSDVWLRYAWADDEYPRVLLICD